ncbi:MAG: cytidylate kinase family protein [Dysosmobacter sp.]|uniref:cytidylate kinase family protein n=1 Tax=Dysosmobacter welbionis TaxID=2093857 RepID=UPI002942B7A4|nr:cytidylate kinase family protein [Dysosmobacter welbionis]
MDNYVITIGRRFGSLGRAVAREAADLLSIQYYGRDIEEEIAKRMKQPVKEISEVEKDAESRFDVFGNILAQVLALSPLHKGYWSARPIWQSDSEGVPLWRWSRHHFANKGPDTDCAVLL